MIQGITNIGPVLSVTNSTQTNSLNPHSPTLQYWESLYFIEGETEAREVNGLRHRWQAVEPG